jgi:hypothetical protein
MTQQEHLQRIRQRCVELLEIAEKRTAGEWDFSPGVYDCSNEATQFPCGPCLNYGKKNELHGQFGLDEDFLFIASCAGAAEAGWRATIAAIDDTLNVDQSLPAEVQKITTDMMIAVNGRMVETIIAAWPEELL